MKSTFLLFLIFGTFLTTQAFGRAQSLAKKSTLKATKATATTAVKPKTITTTTPVVAATPVAPKTAFDKFYERLSIGYYGAVTSPTLQKWNSNNAATSPEWSSTDDPDDDAGGDGKIDGYAPCRNCDTYSFNVWSQVNFGYNYGGKMKFNVIPRFTTFFVTPKNQEPGERGTVLLEDFLVGFSGVVYTSDNKKFNWWMRPGIRLPTSHATKHYNNKDFGKISYNLELTNSFTYDFNTKFQLAMSFQDRYWIYENRYNNSRNRYYIAPNFTYAINDTTKIIGYYENMNENNKRNKSINGKNPVYKNMWQNAYIGIGKDITPKLNVYPYISAFVNDVPFSMRSFWTGVWISYTIK